MAEMSYGAIEETFPWRGCGNGLKDAGPSSLLNKFFNHSVILGFILCLMCVEKLCSQEKTLLCAIAWDCVLGCNVSCRLGKIIIKPEHNPAQFLSGNV